MSSKPDTVLRAITEDGAFRVVVCSTLHTIRECVALQKASGEAARVFGDLLTGTILVRETMSPELRVQGLLQCGARGSRMVADTHPDGATRGLVQLGGKSSTGGAILDQGSLLQMMRTLHNGSLHQGVVEVPTEGGISAALMNYMQSSEQVVSMIAVATIFDGDEVRAAGGYIVQLLPEVDEGPLAVMTERLADFKSIDKLLAEGLAEPGVLLDEILYGMPFKRVGERPVGFGCQCNATRLTASLSTLPKKDIEDFVNDGSVLEIGCDYCGKQYRIAPESLRGLLARN